MNRIFRQVFELLDEREKRRFLILMGLLVAVAFAELLGVGTVLLLLTSLADPSSIEGDGWLAWLYEALDFTSLSSFQIALAAVALVIVFLAQTIKIVGVYARSRYANMRRYSISSKLLSLYLRQPYSWYLQRNSSDVSRKVLGEVNEVIGRVMAPLLELLASGLVAVAILGFLLFFDPYICLASGLLIGGSYVAVYFWQRRKFSKIGQELVKQNEVLFRLTQEAMGGFKELRVLGLEGGYNHRFEGAALEAARYGALSVVLAELPRHVLEAVVFCFLIVLVMVLLLLNDGDLVSIVPTLGIFAFATLRILPAVQRIFYSVTSILVGQESLNQVHQDFELTAQTAAPAMPNSREPLKLEKRLRMNDVSFSYEGSNRAALKNLSMDIARHTTVGIVGGTGAGKSSLVDVILGLLSPDSGEILIDDVPLSDNNLRAWQKSIGYVPQSIFLIDDTVRKNIAFGVAPADIDDERVERAARNASLHEFVEKELPNGYDTIVGERGVRLSGGQRQRIGIARALYSEPSILLLDEATSALDNLTERAVMEAVDGMRNKVTIVMIAHRLSTVRRCDVIYVMDGGQVVASGTYDELLSESMLFRDMAANS